LNNQLTQQEADALLGMEKHYAGTDNIQFPSYGGDLRLLLQSSDKREEFFLDISRGTISLAKNKFQNRARRTIVLARIDIGGAPHRNPDDTEIPCPHIHLYKAGFADKWAEPLSKYFKDANKPIDILNEFMGFCNIITRPIIEEDLFS
jgi:hypothetical protein